MDHSVFPDPIFEPSKLPALEEETMSWSPKEKTYETDLAVLQWVEELEQRVVLSDLQIRVHWDWCWVVNCLREGFGFVKFFVLIYLWVLGCMNVIQHICVVC